MTAHANARILVEVAVDSLAGAEAAAAAGADRIELCANLREGGLTPSLGLVEAVRAAVQIPVFAMLRPRPGDFLYDRGEFAVMLRDVEHLRTAGVGGFVTGMLKADGTFDGERLRELRTAIGPLSCTCHRAFDLCADPVAALPILADLGFARVLTSGQAATAIDGAEAIRHLVEQAGNRLVVVAGAGVRDSNVKQLVAATNVTEVHLSATAWLDSGMTFRRPGIAMASPAPADEYALRSTDGEMVARVLTALLG